MASVYQKRGVWYAGFKDGTGRRRAVRLGAKTKTEARRLAVELEAKGWRQREGLEALPASETETLAELCTWWLEHRCPEPSRQSNRYRLGVHVLRSKLGALLLRQVTAAAVEDYLRAAEGEGMAPASANHLRAVLRTVFSKALKAGRWTGANPIDAVERRRVPRRVHSILKPEEVPLLLAALGEEWRDLFACALFTGMRKGELLGLRKRNVDLARRVILVGNSYDRPVTKGGDIDALPIAEPLAPFLQHAIDSAPGELVFPDANGKMRRADSALEDVLRRALARAGLVEGWEHTCRRCKAKGTPYVERHQDAALRLCPACGMKLWPKALHRPMRFHDTRHTAGTLMVRAGIDLHRVQRVLRHADPQTTASIYLHLEVEDLRSAVASLPQVAPPAAARVAANAPRATRPLPAPGAPQSEGPQFAGFPLESAALTSMSAEGIEPSTYGLRVHCSAS